MTDITEQDRRDAREWANWASTYVDRSMAKAAARVILATVDAPEPTLAEELRDLGSLLEDEGGAGAKSTCWARDLATRVDQMEHYLAEARALAAALLAAVAWAEQQ